MKIIHCQNTLKLSQNLELDVIETRISIFATGEIGIKIYDDLRGEEILIIHNMFPNINDNLMQLLLIINAAKARGARHVQALVPYLPYSRMDKDKATGIAGLKSIATLLESAGLDSLITVDLHSEDSKKLFNIPVQNITALEVFKHKLLGYKNKDCVIVSPDFGGKTRCRHIAEFLVKPLAILEKTRTATGITIKGMTGDVVGKHCVLVDDIISSGDTILQAIRFLKKSGVKSVDVMVTHNLLRDNARLEEIKHGASGFLEADINTYIPQLSLSTLP